MVLRLLPDLHLAGQRSGPRRGREDARVVVLADGVACGIPAPRLRRYGKAGNWRGATHSGLAAPVNDGAVGAEEGGEQGSVNDGSVFLPSVEFSE